MSTKRNIEKMISESHIKTNAKRDQAVLENLCNVLHDTNKLEANSKGVSFFEGFMKNSIIKTGLSVAVILLIIFGINFLSDFKNSLGGVNITFAQVIERLQNIQTLTYTQIESGSETNKIAEYYCKEPYYAKVVTSDGMEWTINKIENKGFMINHKAKVYGEFYFTDLPENSNVLERLKQLPAKADKDLGEKEINGKIVQGYLVSSGKWNTTIWVDPETANPVEVEIVDIDSLGSARTMKDFKFNEPIDDSFFCTTFPSTYKRMDLSFMDNITEKDFILYLQAYAQSNIDKEFPTDLNYSHDASRMVSASSLPHIQERGKLTEANRRIYMRATQFLLRLQPENDAHYVGNTIKLGDAAPIFWYRPNGSKNYRIIYGDLSVREVTQDQLPAQPKLEPGETPVGFFEEVTEQVIYSAVSMESAIDFDTKKMFKGPDYIPDEEAFKNWRTENGIDALAMIADPPYGLSGFDMIVIGVDAELWDTPPHTLKYALSQGAPGAMVRMCDKGELPATFLIKTREGKAGILQIIKINTAEEPKYIEVRYKMLKEKS